MARRVQERKHATKREAKTEEKAASSQEKGEALKAELDDLLDEIDGVLEENAADFVSNDIPRGGE